MAKFDQIEQQVFYADEREAAISPTHVVSPLTLEYIARLEKIAFAAWEMYKVTPHAGNPLLASCANEVYDLLARVNFLDESL